MTNGVVNYGQTRPREPDAIITTTSFALASMAHELTTLADEIATNSTTIDGNVAGFQSFLGLLDQFELFFAIIEP